MNRQDFRATEAALNTVMLAYNLTSYYAGIAQNQCGQAFF